ncbi:MAG: hypothetical protein QOI06_1701 [Nocardioidaceae bacterium]|jgi:hypothetical protein|nr:hypothetical protein [Nocardioidaceae bacterium]
MCTYETQSCAVVGSGKGAIGWFPLTRATIYYDHPVHADAGHTLNIDFAAPERGPSARVAVELTAESALRLLSSVAQALICAPAEISGLTSEQLEELGVVAGLARLPRPEVALGATSVAPSAE